MSTATVVAPGFRRTVPIEADEPVQRVAERAATEGGGSLPQNPIFIRDGSKVQPQELIGEGEPHLTVASNAVNG